MLVSLLGKIFENLYINILYYNLKTWFCKYLNNNCSRDPAKGYAQLQVLEVSLSDGHDSCQFLMACNVTTVVRGKGP